MLVRVLFFPSPFPFVRYWFLLFCFFVCLFAVLAASINLACGFLRFDLLVFALCVLYVSLFHAQIFAFFLHYLCILSLKSIVLKPPNGSSTLHKNNPSKD